MRRIAAAFVIALALFVGQGSTSSDSGPNSSTSAIQMETLLKTSNAWDGSAYATYPSGKPEVSVLKITIPAKTTMDWHSHPIPNVAYVLSGELTVEKKDGSATRHFTPGQAVPEIVGVAHRGVTGERPVELIVFYAGAPGLPLSARQ